MKLGAKYILSISLFVPLVLGVSFTLIIKRQDYLLEDEIKKHANILVKQIEMIHSRLAEAQNSFNTGRAGSNTVFIHLHPSEICAEFSNTSTKTDHNTVRLIALKHINTDNHPDDLEEAVLKNMEEQNHMMRIVVSRLA
ncbi:c-type heme family protein [Candidatus Kuenenia stuttgartensis]|uniref:c-type heme family protein n=1 Tax=Kuenenia stuttgartiensis TaxID=174633 RepID=UPI001469A7E3|nr:DUF3365 domain-containing protein [Candidatus Kuenenia stuttgartiensis]